MLWIIGLPLMTKRDATLEVITRLNAASGTFKLRKIKVVYLIQAGVKYKIGKSRSVRQMLWRIRKSYADARLVCTIRTSDPIALERGMKERFKAYEFEKGWFALPDNLVDFLKGEGNEPKHPKKP